MMTENFWDVNPNVLSITDFKKFYDSDTSKNKNKSSKIMWAIAALEDLHSENPYRHLIYEDKLKVIQEDILKKEYKLEDYQELIAVYKKFCTSEIDLMISTYKKRLEDRISLLQSYEYTIENAKLLDELLIKTNQLYIEYNKLIEIAEKERVIETKNKGGGLESISEEGII